MGPSTRHQEAFNAHKTRQAHRTEPARRAVRATRLRPLGHAVETATNYGTLRGSNAVVIAHPPEAIKTVAQRGRECVIGVPRGDPTGHPVLRMHAPMHRAHDASCTCMRMHPCIRACARSMHHGFRVQCTVHPAQHLHPWRAHAPRDAYPYARSIARARVTALACARQRTSRTRNRSRTRRSGAGGGALRQDR